MLVAGKGLGKDVTNGSAARPVVAAREGRARTEESPREGRNSGRRCEPEEALSHEREPGGLRMSRARASLPPQARASRAEVD